MYSKLDTHRAEASTYLKMAHQARAKFSSTGDLAQSDWAAKYLHAARMHAALVVELGGEVPAEPELQPEAEAPRAPNAVDLAAEAAIEAMRERGRQQRREARPEPRPSVQAAPVVRDCRVKAMRRFWAICKAQGLDARNAEAMTVALSKYLGCIIPSRSQLSSGQWCEAAEAVELGVLAW